MVLFRPYSLCYQAKCTSEMWNFIARLVILSLIIGSLGASVCGVHSYIVCFMFAIVLFIVGDIAMTTSAEAHTKPHSAEGFSAYSPSYKDPQDAGGRGGIMPSVYGVEAELPDDTGAPYKRSAKYTSPTARNPFMNVLLDDIKYNPERPAAAPVTDPLVKQSLDDYFRVQWFSDPTDVFGKNQSQRQFITQPSTSVPNDRKSFQEWLYKIPGKTCKEGGREACLPGTDGGPITWLNQDS